MNTVVQSRPGKQCTRFLYVCSIKTSSSLFQFSFSVLIMCQLSTDCHHLIRTTCQTSRPETSVSQSLLDALLISPITDTPSLRLRRKKKRRSVSDLQLPKNKRCAEQTWTKSFLQKRKWAVILKTNTYFDLIFCKIKFCPGLNHYKRLLYK